MLVSQEPETMENTRQAIKKTIQYYLYLTFPAECSGLGGGAGECVCVCVCECVCVCVCVRMCVCACVHTEH